MPKAFPPEFRRDVVAVARKGEAQVAQVAKDFGTSEVVSAPLARPEMGSLFRQTAAPQVPIDLNAADVQDVAEG